MYNLKNKINKKVTNSWIQTTNRWSPGGRGVGGMCEKGKGIKKHNLAVIKQSQECKVQHRESSQ